MLSENGAVWYISVPLSCIIVYDSSMIYYLNEKGKLPKQMYVGVSRTACFRQWEDVYFLEILRTSRHESSCIFAILSILLGGHFFFFRITCEIFSHFLQFCQNS